MLAAVTVKQKVPFPPLHLFSPTTPSDNASLSSVSPNSSSFPSQLKAPLEFKKVPVPKLKDDELLVKIVASGIWLVDLRGVWKKKNWTGRGAHTLP